MPNFSLETLEKTRVSTFDYSRLPEGSAQQAQKAAAGINRMANQHIRIIGRHLIEAKEALPHGLFTEWAEAELGMTARTAQNIMSASRWLEDKGEAISLLPATVIYKLASPATPAPIVQAIVAEAAAGELPGGEVVAHRINIACAEQREVKRLIAKKPGTSDEEARSRLAKSRKDKAQRAARHEESWRREAEAHRAEEETRRAQQREVFGRLAKTYPDVLREILAVIGGHPDIMRGTITEALHMAAGGEA